MKKLEIKFLKSYNAIIGVILALIGFASSCIIKSEYGTPSAKFIVKGKVESSGDNKVIPNIRVVMLGDSIITDINGDYQVTNKHGFPEDQTYNIKFKDIDNALNGEFENLDTIVEFKDPIFKNGDGDWYKGETEKEFNIKLDPKK
jgi:putative lipoprotein (rSAM/lipoprotein system)